jgi:hypothetical protein
MAGGRLKQPDRAVTSNMVPCPGPLHGHHLGSHTSLQRMHREVLIEVRGLTSAAATEMVALCTSNPTYVIVCIRPVPHA